MGQFEEVSPDALKDVLLKKTSEKTILSEDIVEKIISFQFKEARDRMHDFNEIEISGFGKFQVSQKRLKDNVREIQAIVVNLEKAIIMSKLTPAKVINFTKKLESSNILLDDLTPRLRITKK